MLIPDVLCRVAVILTVAMMLALYPRLASTAENQSDSAVTQEARSQASDVFENRCSACHGMEGRGDGPAAANLKPKPADFHSPKWQKSITDDRIARAIVHGGGSVGVSNQMAPNPDLENQPAVVAALVEQIRKWGK